MKVERLIEIMSDDNIGGELLFEAKDNALEGLQILNKYTEDSVLEGANHDVIYSIDIDKTIEGGITEEEVIKLRKLNWMLEDDFYFVCFV